MNEIETSTIIIILAAGKGTRMQSNLPKVLHPINNKPMLLYVTDVAKTLNPDKIIVVIGYKKELIIKALSNENIIFVEQKNQNGTASAINECIPSIKNFKGNILILSGDRIIFAFCLILFENFCANSLLFNIFKIDWAKVM